MNIFKFLPFLALAALAISVPALAQNDPMSAGSFSGVDVETAVGSEMMETSQDADDDLKDQMRRVKEQNEKKKALRETSQEMKGERRKLREASGTSNPPLKKTPVLGKTPTTKPAGEGDSLSNLGQRAQDRMEQNIDRMEKADQAASDAQKKYSDTESSITGNLK
jgi:hypothetical protein